MINVIGCGRWGVFLGWYVVNHTMQKEVKIFGRADGLDYQELRDTRKNQFLELSDGMEMTDSLEETLKADYIIISITSQNLKYLAEDLNKYKLDGKTFILAMKGIDIDLQKRLSEVMKDKIKQDIKIAVLLGPGHVQDYTSGVPSCAIIDSDDEETKKKVVDLLSSNLMRLYYGNDLIGNEIGGALKNVVGIAAGILDGLKWQGLKGALMSRSPVEIMRFIEKCGGNPISVYGLAHLGDYEATLFSPFSNNRLFGEKFVEGEIITKTCEGYYTLKVIYEMSQNFNLEMPIVNVLYDIIYNKKDIKENINKLFTRSIKSEF